jgi:hypothetical protein
MMPQFTVHIAMKNKKQNKSCEKLIKNKRSKFIVLQLCILLKTIIVFHILPLENFLGQTSLKKNIENFIHSQFSHLRHHLNSILTVLFPPTLYVLNLLCPTCLRIDIIILTPFAYLAWFLKYSLALNNIHHVFAFDFLIPWPKFKTRLAFVHAVWKSCCLVLFVPVTILNYFTIGYSTLNYYMQLLYFFYLRFLYYISSYLKLLYFKIKQLIIT